MIKSKSMKLFRAGLLISFIIFSLAAPAFSEGTYPNKPIKLIVPYSPGGATDLAARVLASTIPEFLLQAVIVVNKPGGGGSIGFDSVRKSKADGYTMMMAAVGANCLNPALNTKLPYTYDELTYIARTQINPNVIAVNARSKYKTLADLTDALKSGKKKFHFAASGIGQVSHLGPIQLLSELGLDTDSVPPIMYDSGNDALLAVIQGEADFVQTNISALSSALKGGLIRGLAITTPERLPSFKEIPTYTEGGLPAIDIVGWRGVAGPPGLPAEVIKVWEDAVKKTTESKSWIKLTKKLGDEPNYMNAAEFNAFIDTNFTRFRKMATDLNLLIK
jgi:tripartite-type tricarboxylate transporter receptor subunit TctC